MAISYVGGKTVGSAGQGGGSIAIDTGLTGGSGGAPIAGDLVVVTVSVGSAGRAPTLAISTPSGFTALTAQRTTATTYDTNVQTCYKIMGSTPDTAVTIPASGSSQDGIAYTIQVFRDVSLHTPMDTAATYATGSAVNSRPVPAAITPVTSGAWIVVCGGGAAATGAAYTASYLTNFLTSFGSDNNDGLIGCGYYTGWTSGAYTPATFAGGSATTADSWGCTTIALRPGTTYTGGVTETGNAGATFNQTGSSAVGIGESLAELSGNGYNNKISATVTQEKLSFNNETVSSFGEGMGNSASPASPVVSTSSGYTHPYANNIGLAFSFATGTKRSITGVTSLTSMGEVVGASCPLFGLWMGGQDASYVFKSSVVKTTFATEVGSTLAATLSAAYGSNVGVTSSTTAYSVGGRNDVGNVSTISGITISTEAAKSVSATLSTLVTAAAPVMSTAKGYSVGGNRGNPNYWYGGIQALNFSSEAIAVLGSALTTVRSMAAGTFSPTAGYIAGGEIGVSTTTTSIEKILFSSEAVSTLSATLAHTGTVTENGFTAVGYPGPLGTSSVPDIPPVTASIAETCSSGEQSDQQIVIPITEAATSADTKTTSISQSVSITNAATAKETRLEIYTPRGYVFTTTPSVMSFPTESFSETVTYPYYRAGDRAVEGYDNAYIAGGYDTGNASVDQYLIRFSFRTETASIASTTRLDKESATASSSTKGFWAGGFYSVLDSNTIDYVTFLTETSGSNSSSLTANGKAPSGVQSATKAYYHCGTFVNIQLFSTDAISSTSSAPTNHKYRAGGASGADRGHFMGGGDTTDSGIRSNTTDLVTFSTDAYSTSATVLSVGRTASICISSSTRGYVLGGEDVGSQPTSTVDGIVFSTQAAFTASNALPSTLYGDTPSAQWNFQQPKTGENLEAGSGADSTDGVVDNSSASRSEAASAQVSQPMTYTTQGFGVFFGGQDSGAVFKTNSEKFNFYDEAISSLGSMSYAIGAMAATNRTDGGLWAGGFSTNASDSVFFFSYDSMAHILQSCTLLYTAYSLGSVFSPNNWGYFSGGKTIGGSKISTTNSVSNTFTAGAVSALALSAVRDLLTGMSSEFYGYMMGGKNSSGTLLDIIERFQFSNETKATPSAVITEARSSATGLANYTNGYYAGSSNASFILYEIMKFVFSTETASVNSSSLAVARNLGGGTQNNDVGYIAGGWDGASTVTADIEKITFSTGTVGNPTTALGLARSNLAGVSTIVQTTTYTRDATEAGTAASIHDSLGSQSLARTDAASATDAILAAFIAQGAVIEAAAATDTKSSIFIYAVTQPESVAGTGTPTATFTVLSAATEPATSVDTKTVQTAFVSAESEPATAVDTKTVQTDFASAKTEPATATDAPAGTWTTAASETEAGSATDTPTGISATPVDRAEPNPATEIESAVAAFVSAKVEPATATDAPAGTWTTASATTEPGSATESESANSAAVAAQVENVTSSDSETALAAFVSVATEPSTATESETALSGLASTVTESATATDTTNYTFVAAVTITELAPATSTEIGIYSAQISHAEPATASAIHDGSTITGGTTYSDGTTEPASADDTKTVQAAMVAADTAAVTSTDAPTVTWVALADRTEASSAITAQDRAFVADVSTSESSAATDSENFSSGNLASEIEQAFAIDAGYATYITSVAQIDAASALAEQAYAALKYAAQDESALAAALADRNVTVFVSNDANASAFDLSSVVAAFVVQNDALTSAVDLSSVTAQFAATIEEVSTAVTASWRWLSGTDGSKRVSVFVTTSGNSVVCYLKPAPSVLAEKQKPRVVATAAPKPVAIASAKAASVFVEKDEAE